MHTLGKVNKRRQEMPGKKPIGFQLQAGLGDTRYSRSGANLRCIRRQTRDACSTSALYEGPRDRLPT